MLGRHSNIHAEQNPTHDSRGNYEQTERENEEENRIEMQEKKVDQRCVENEFTE